MADEEYQMLFKVILIGDSGVGKSNILSRYILDEFNIDTKATVGVEFGSKMIEKDPNTKIKVQIWDTAGQERYKSITNAYYKGAKGAFIVYDISREETFKNVDKWFSELRNNSDENVFVIIIGNKCDMEDQRQVPKESGESKAQELKTAFMETSALQAVNIEEAFEKMVDEIYQKAKPSLDKKTESKEQTPDSNDKPIILKGNNEKEAKKKRKCCGGKK
ncbi:MAG: GTP-binding protein [archaeon]|nr:GTP-binding protein [archaeon]